MDGIKGLELTFTDEVVEAEEIGSDPEGANDEGIVSEKAFLSIVSYCSFFRRFTWSTKDAFPEAKPI